MEQKRNIKEELAIGAVEVLTAIGVGTLVGGAMVLVKPVKLNVIKNVACGVASVAIGSMATEEVNAYVDKTLREAIGFVKGCLKKKKELPEEDESEEESTEE